MPQVGSSLPWPFDFHNSVFSRWGNWVKRSKVYLFKSEFNYVWNPILSNTKFHIHSGWPQSLQKEATALCNKSNNGDDDAIKYNFGNCLQLKENSLHNRWSIYPLCSWNYKYSDARLYMESGKKVQ